MATETAPRTVRRRLVAAWTIAWLVGITTLVSIALTEGLSRRQNARDQELALRAMAVYGLTWFEDDGSFNHSVLDREPIMQEPDASIWVVDLDESIALRPTAPGPVHGTETEVIALARTLLEGGATENVVRDGAGARLLAAPLFGDRDDAMRGVVVVAGSNATVREETRAFVGWVVGTGIVVGLLGLAVGLWLAERSVRPLRASLAQRRHFLSAAAHELRTPVATLQAVCESALAGDEPAERALERVAAIADRAGASVEDLLLFARLTSQDVEQGLRREAVRVDLLAEKVMDEFDGVALDGQEVTASVDGGLLEVAVRNLVRNAVEHGETPVQIRVKESSIEVRDAGAGYPPATLERVEAFASGARGRGLGLSIVDRIARLHGAALRLENGPRGGAVATIELAPVRA